MKQRKFGKLDWKVSVLGFGAMRLPIVDNDASKINEPEAIRLIMWTRLGMDSRFNLFLQSFFRFLNCFL